MSTIKTVVSDDSVEDFINSVPNEEKRQDSCVLIKLFSQITGEKPKMWSSSIIGFGVYRYKSEKSSQENEWSLVAFSPRKQNLTLYLMLGLGDYQDLLDKLGKHKTKGGCPYINKLTDVDLAVLEQLIKKSFAAMKAKYS